jgi:hypothetical protein
MQLMIKISCWEFKKCGRETDGSNADELGICPASLTNEYNNINYGQFGGRFCWSIAGTFCQGRVNGTFAKKLPSCVNCDFLKSVHYEEGGNFILTPTVAKKKLNIKGEFPST